MHIFPFSFAKCIDLCGLGCAEPLNIYDLFSIYIETISVPSFALLLDSRDASSLSPDIILALSLSYFSECYDTEDNSVHLSQLEELEVAYALL